MCYFYLFMVLWFWQIFNRCGYLQVFQQNLKFILRMQVKEMWKLKCLIVRERKYLWKLNFLLKIKFMMLFIIFLLLGNIQFILFLVLKIFLRVFFKLVLFKLIVLFVVFMDLVLRRYGNFLFWVCMFFLFFCYENFDLMFVDNY